MHLQNIVCKMAIFCAVISINKMQYFARKITATQIIGVTNHWSYSTLRKYSKPYLRTHGNNPHVWHPSVSTESIRLGPVLTDPESVPTPSCSPVNPFLRFVVTELRRMKSVRTEGCHVGLFRGFVHCRYGLPYLRTVEYDLCSPASSVSVCLFV